MVQSMAYADIWTDHTGAVHERSPHDDTATQCGQLIGVHYVPRAVRACTACVGEHLQREHSTANEAVAVGGR